MKFRPCPFCKSTNIKFEDDCPQFHWECKGCEMLFNSTDEDAWNKRDNRCADLKIRGVIELILDCLENDSDDPAQTLADILIEFRDSRTPTAEGGER